MTEVALARDARIEPHSSPNTTWFIVVEGGGWVGVGEEWTRIAAGEAALWPADVPHTAWTEHSEMRAIVVELAGADDRDTVSGTGAPRRVGIRSRSSAGSAGWPPGPGRSTARTRATASRSETGRPSLGSSSAPGPCPGPGTC